MKKSVIDPPIAITRADLCDRWDSNDKAQYEEGQRNGIHWFLQVASRQEVEACGWAGASATDREIAERERFFTRQYRSDILTPLFGLAANLHSCTKSSIADRE